jgi:hypothetical protein
MRFRTQMVCQIDRSDRLTSLKSTLTARISYLTSLEFTINSARISLSMTTGRVVKAVCGKYLEPCKTSTFVCYVTCCGYLASQDPLAVGIRIYFRLFISIAKQYQDLKFNPFKIRHWNVSFGLLGHHWVRWNWKTAVPSFRAIAIRVLVFAVFLNEFNAVPLSTTRIVSVLCNDIRVRNLVSGDKGGTDWGYLRTEENILTEKRSNDCVITSSITCTLRKVKLEWWRQEGWDGHGM